MNTNRCLVNYGTIDHLQQCNNNVSQNAQFCNQHKRMIPSFLRGAIVIFYNSTGKIPEIITLRELSSDYGIRNYKQNLELEALREEEQNRSNNIISILEGYLVNDYREDENSVIGKQCMKEFHKDIKCSGCYNENNKKQCSICLEPVKCAYSGYMTVCNHHYHPECINEWKQTGKDTCPVCRHKL